MPEHHKLTAPLHGRPLIRHSVENAVGSRLRPVVVVTGHEAAKVRAVLDGLAVCFIHNAEFAGGLSTSLRAGIAALPKGLAGVVVALGDMPAVQPALLDRLAEAIATGSSAVAVPVINGRRGNPVAWSSRLFPEMLRLTGDVGARHLIDAYRDQLVEIPIEDEGVLLDVDTREQLDELERRARET